MKSYLKRIVSLILAISLFMCFAVWTMASDATEDVLLEDNGGMDFDCVSAILMDAATGTVFYEKNADAALPPASVTKIMTL